MDGASPATVNGAGHWRQKDYSMKNDTLQCSDWFVAPPQQPGDKWLVVRTFDTLGADFETHEILFGSCHDVDSEHDTKELADKRRAEIKGTNPKPGYEMVPAHEDREIMYENEMTRSVGLMATCNNCDRVIYVDENWKDEYSNNGGYCKDCAPEPAAREMSREEEQEWDALNDNMDWMSDQQIKDAGDAIRKKYTSNQKP